MLSPLLSLRRRRATRPLGVRAVLLSVLWFFVLPLEAPAAEFSGPEIMAQSQRRHQQFPYVYEEQTMILIDAAGHRKVRRSRLYTRAQADGNLNFLLIFDQPQDIRGVALLASRDSGGHIHRGVYLPAFGQEIKQPRGSGLDSQFLGTDFTIADLTPEPAQDFRYVRRRDRQIEGRAFFVVDAYPRAATHRLGGGYGLRKHLLRQDNFFIVRTDVYDVNSNFYKRISYHDLKRVDGDSWRANTIIAHDRREAHRTVLKIDRRVYSQDYVPAEIFEEAYLLANRHVSNPAFGVHRVITSRAERLLLERTSD